MENPVLIDSALLEPDYMPNGAYKKTTTFYTNGNIKELYYHDNLRMDITEDNYSGPYRKWYENGNRYKCCNYALSDKSDRNGKLNGPYYEYYKDGSPHIKCNYKFGKLDGEYLIYNEKGEIHLKTTYKDGKVEELYELNYNNGKPDIVCNYKNGKLYGNYKSYWSNGNLAQYCNYKNDLKEGKEFRYWEVVGIYGKCNYKDGKKHGKEKIYDSKGNLETTKYFNNGKVEKVIDEDEEINYNANGNITGIHKRSGENYANFYEDGVVIKRARLED